MSHHGPWRRWLVEPRSRDLDLDDPSTTGVRRLIVAEKRLLRDVYAEWHALLAAVVPPLPGAALEIGGGAAEFNAIPGLVRSEVFWCPWLELTLDGQSLPVADASLRAIVMVNVLHHVPEPALLLREASRAVRAGGVLTMIEPWVTSFSRLVYGHFHHEPFEPEAAHWQARGAGPLSRANGALPWILFRRDRDEFEQLFPEWTLELARPLPGLRYLASGGVSLRSLGPAWSSPLWGAFEQALAPWHPRLGMFAHIVLRRGPLA